jgi:hypothetical protein
MSTDFSIKCEILAEVHLEATWNIDLNDFREYNDLGLPLAYSFHMGLIELKEGAESYIEDTWDSLCQMLGVDKEDEFENADDMLSKSPVIESLEDDEE